MGTCGGSVRRSRYYVWAVLDVEGWSGRPAVNAANIQDALRRMERRALAAAGIDEARVKRQARGDGAILALPGDVAKEVITAQFVEAFREAVVEHDADCDPQEQIRIRLSLHAGDVIEGDGEWAGQPVIAACRLVDSAVLRRVLAASVPSPLALIVSGDWYDAVVKEGHISGQGYREVWVKEKTFASRAWIKVPGRSSPLGLQPGDEPGQHRDGPPRPPRAAGPDQAPVYVREINSGNMIKDSTIKGDVVFGDKVVGGDLRSGGGGR
jgi:hypothetical protein